METFQQPNSGTVITNSDRGLHVVIPIKNQWGMVTLCAIFILLFGMVTLLMLLGIPDVLGDPNKPLWLFILFLVVLIAADTLFIGLLLWSLTGKILVHVNSIDMVLRYKMLGFAHERKFELEKIHDLRVRNFKEIALPKSAVDYMDDETFVALLESDAANFMLRETFFDRLMKVDLTKLQKLRPDDLKTPKNPLSAYKFSNGFCSGILFDYNTKRYEFGVNLINGMEAEQLINIITERYRILGSRKD